MDKRITSNLTNFCFTTLILPEFLLVENVQGLIAVDPDQLFMCRINHQIHRLKGQRSEEYVLRY
jgi:hypothetical protein